MDNGTFTFELICDKYTEDLKNKSIAPRKSYSDMVVKPSGCVLPLTFRDAVETIRNFKVLPDDTWVVTFPKCGTTWTQEMVWLLKNNCDFEKAKAIPLLQRVPFFEFEKLTFTEDKSLDPVPPTMELTEKLASPRCIKSHLPMELLPKQLWTVKPKIVYVARDPRDVAISYYHHHRLWNGYQGTLEDFVDAFLNDRVVYGPYWTHLLTFMDLKDKSHILINTYEEMKRDLPNVIRKTAKFLNVELSEKQIHDLNEHLSFKSMRSNKSVNYEELGNEVKKLVKADETDENLNFIRKGESGGWMNAFGNDTLEKFKKWNERHLSGRDFKEYPWSLN
ncbi:UNVERIFIED_CONTAM: hypothetical protein PYX00_010361 [Menopon gallinae]|uniref:Sulfotransferase domain-containing protein n=1 Tax=Menopon gallinae TaxID=328185 RepID=A0AAW2HFF0_9NEOP